MATYRVSRAVVREALGMLRSEGLIERTQGVGTTSRAKVNDALLLEAHGGHVGTGQRALLEEMRPHIIDRSMATMTAEVAAALGMQAGEPCLRLDYVSLINDEPTALATNYVRSPEAEAIASTPFTADWYRLLRDAGVATGQSRFIIGGAPADSLVAAHLEVAPGSPLITLEQVIHDADGRPFDLAFVHIRTDRFRFVSWSDFESTSRSLI